MKKILLISAIAVGLGLSAVAWAECDRYKLPAGEGKCQICAGRGYVICDGRQERCDPCNGSGQAVPFPKPRN